MTEKDPAPRLPLVDKPNWTDEVQGMFDVFAGPGWENVDDNHVLGTFAWHPPVATPFLEFNRYLLSGSTLPPRERQIAILRVAWLKKDRYMWSSHLRTTMRSGVSDEVFDPVKEGADAALWTEAERCVLRATDQLVASSKLDDATWAELSEHLDRQQVLDFLFTVGTYLMLTVPFQALKVDREQVLLDLAAKYGEPPL